MTELGSALAADGLEAGTPTRIALAFGVEGAAGGVNREVLVPKQAYSPAREDRKGA
jgi:hypothetical protein